MSFTIVLPSKGERENLAVLLPSLFALPDLAGIVIVEDSDVPTSVLTSLVPSHQRLRLLILRGDRQGYGPAVLKGLRCAMATTPLIVTMDADRSHSPFDVAGLVALCDFADLVIGSRFLRGSSHSGLPFYRRVLSMTASAVTGATIRMAYSDVSSGFRCYRANILKALLKTPPSSRGFGFNIELLIHLHQKQVTILEYPISFRPRGRGSSKFKVSMILESVRMLWLAHARERPF